ncbi:MAG TPA: Gfo/Idh/MocA family oxidoreductase [Bryobacteraceae bacterium]|nr:Gfo/Idh/MocA family oxidoreductase [Bryobacteraceae bacterium]
MTKIRVAVVGAGVFGRHHLRVLSQSLNATLVGVVDADPERAAQAAAEHNCLTFATLGELEGNIDAAVVAVPTSFHAQVGCELLASGIDVLVEKPIAADLASARRLVDTATEYGRILQIGHLERFNPAVAALQKIRTIPLFFEIHRLSLFSPRSLDVDVVLDLMIHDLDIVLALTEAEPEEISAAGISILSDKVDIANARLSFPGGCIANLTASRVSTERVRKLRLFQPHQYISLDYQKQEAVAFTVGANQQIGFQPLPVTKEEPLRLEIESFLEAVATRRRPVVSGEDGLRALEAARAILDKIEEHSRIVTQRLQSLS